MRLLPAPKSLRGSLRATALFYPPCQLLKYSSNIQSVAQPKFWASLVPKPLRKPFEIEKFKSKRWNPATFYIIIFLLIGSMPVQMIALRNEFSAFGRRADARIDLLREAIERVQKGEEVDVGVFLGTDDPLKEKGWEEVIQEIEKEDRLWNELQHRKHKRSGHAYSNEPFIDGDVRTSPAAVADKGSAKHKTTYNFPEFY